ncbi:MAG TPA: DUF4292 domain-containing protein [Ferruginibacter sp.]|nr:DUF4292 domain-containing protein [Ferruginibacter sp.]
MKQSLLLITAVAGFSMYSCHPTKNINKAIAPRDTAKITVNTTADSVLLRMATLENLGKNYLDFKTFSAKIKVDVEDSKGKQTDLNAVVRIIKDEAIWISLSATIFNAEVFRILITKDSVILLNKLEKEVQYRSLDYLQEVTQIPFDFTTVQDLLIGNPVFFNQSNAVIKKLESFVLVSTVGNEFKNLLTLSNGYNLMLHSKLDDVDRNRNRTADLTYDDYTSNNGKYFSVRRQIIASEKNKIDIRLLFKQFEFNKELSVAFSVPKNYKKK